MILRRDEQCRSSRQRNVERLSQLVREDRSETGVCGYQRGRSRSVRSSRAELKDNGVTAQTKLASALPSLQGDRNQLYQVLYNLIHNAIEAMSDTADRSRVLDVRTELRGNDTIVVEVADTGPGIDPDRMAEIFEAFVTTKPHGTGLGLAICRMIVERHDGQLSVSSAEPRGAIFRITLPRSIRFTDGFSDIPV